MPLKVILSQVAANDIVDMEEEKKKKIPTKARNKLKRKSFYCLA